MTPARCRCSGRRSPTAPGSGGSAASRWPRWWSARCCTWSAGAPRRPRAAATPCRPPDRAAEGLPAGGPLVDHHCHSLSAGWHRVGGGPWPAWRRCFTEAGRPASLATDVPGLLGYRHFLTALAGLLDAGTAGSPEDLERLLADRRDRLAGADPAGWLRRLLDHAAAVEERLAGALDRGAGAVKSIAAYRGGLRLAGSTPLQRRQVFAGLDRAAQAARFDDPVLEPFLVRRAAELAAERLVPLQFHTGFGDEDVDLPLADPAAADLVRQALGLCPAGKLLAASDGHSFPEMHWWGATVWRRALDRVLREEVDAGGLDEPAAGAPAPPAGRVGAEDAHAEAQAGPAAAVLAQPLHLGLVAGQP